MFIKAKAMLYKHITSNDRLQSTRKCNYDDQRQNAVIPWPYLGMRSTGTEVVHDASSLRLVSAVTGVHGTQHCEVSATFSGVFTSLHLTVDDAGIFTVTVDVVHFCNVARSLQT